jgi:hypothetical protein
MGISKNTFFFAPFALIAAALILPSCKVERTDGGSKDESEHNFVVSGSLSVNDASPDDDPISNALVYLKRDDGYVGDPAVTVAGYYDISAVPPGRYTLCAYLEGYTEYNSASFIVDGNKYNMNIMLISGSISINQVGTHVFTSGDPLSVIISSLGPSNTGELTVALSGATPDAFVLSKETIPAIAKGATDTFTVLPDILKPTGVYMATVGISGNNVAPVSFDVQFAIVGKD